MPVARLTSAKNIIFLDNIIGSGTSKDVYFTEDKQSVVLFYRNPKVHDDPLYRNRLKAICGQFNLTVPRSEGGAAKSSEEAERMKKLFCWPTGITVFPKLGLVTPIFPDRYWFNRNPETTPLRWEWKKTEKAAKWFTLKGQWSRLAKRERGNLESCLKICILLSHAISRLHIMGLAHSDLSSNNILIDPLLLSENGSWPGCYVIDLDTLVVPEFYPPAVLGTKEYIAPEVLATSELETKDRIFPSIASDKHSLAVLIYQILLNRHPLDGKKIRCIEDEDIDEFMALGQDAIFIENPHDTSNPPFKQPRTVYTNLGDQLSSIIYRAFVESLHNPGARPLAVEWENALWATLDLLHPCSTRACLWQSFVYDRGAESSCPRCNSRAPEPVPILEFLTAGGDRDVHTGSVVCWHGRKLQHRHVDKNVGPVPFENTPYAEILYNPSENQWLIKNYRIDGLKLLGPTQKTIHRNSQDILVGGAVLQLGTLQSSRQARFNLKS